MQQAQEFQSSFPSVLSNTVREELRANPEYKFHVFYSDSCRHTMLRLDGIRWDDRYLDHVPEAIHAIYQMLVFCQMDDFGNLVERDPFPHYYEGYQSYVGYEFDGGWEEDVFMWWSICH
jgi:hypothetical protein